MVRGRLLHRPHGRAADGHDQVRRERNKFRCGSADGSGLAAGRAIVDLQVSANRPAQLLEALFEHHVSCLCLWIGRREWYEHANAPNALGLLCVRGERPSHGRAAEQRDELASLHAPPEDHALYNR